MAQSSRADAARWRVPPGLRVPRLEQLLGHRLEELHFAAVGGLVDRQVPEDLVLEFKGDRYGRDEKSLNELGKDPTAMANAAGGLILIGVAEDEQGRARDLTSVELDDAERRRMLDVLLQRIAPLVPDLVVGELPDPADPTRGVYAIAVPASEAGPHGIRRNDSYAWPVREDRHTRWMHEPELATRYRDRFAGLRRQTDRVAEVAVEAVARLARTERGWLAVTTVPSRSGRLPVDREASRERLRAALQRFPGGISADAAALVGRRRVVHSNSAFYSGTSDDHHIELHVDGAGFAAVALARPEGLTTARADLAAGQQVLRFDAAAIEGWTLTLLGLLTDHAVRSGAGGDLAAQGVLLTGPPRDEFLFEGSVPANPAPLPAAIFEPYEAGTPPRLAGHRLVPGSLLLTRPTPLETTVPLAAATRVAELVAAAADCAAELLAEFGVAGPRLLRGDGRVDPDGDVSGRSGSLLSWARSHRLLLGEEERDE